MSLQRKLNRKNNPKEDVNLDQLIERVSQVAGKATLNLLTAIALDILENDYGKLIRKDTRAENFKNMLAERFAKLSPEERQASVQKVLEELNE